MPVHTGIPIVLNRSQVHLYIVYRIKKRHRACSRKKTAAKNDYRIRWGYHQVVHVENLRQQNLGF
jgi:hypothetical protein